MFRVIKMECDLISIKISYVRQLEFIVLSLSSYTKSTNLKQRDGSKWIRNLLLFSVMLCVGVEEGGG